MVANCLINVKIDQNIITLVNIYAPNNEQYRVDFCKRMQTFINQFSLNTENIIMCGQVLHGVTLIMYLKAELIMFS